MYSDEWLAKGYACSKNIPVSASVKYRIWSDKDGAAVGVTIDFDIANDFHYELRISDWNKFLEEVLHDNSPTNTERAFCKFLRNNTGLFDFEEQLKSMGIEYNKIAFY